MNGKMNANTKGFILPLPLFMAIPPDPTALLRKGIHEQNHF
jgi:hypothetical protein